MSLSLLELCLRKVTSLKYPTHILPKTLRKEISKYEYCEQCNRRYAKELKECPCYIWRHVCYFCCEKIGKTRIEKNYCSYGCKSMDPKRGPTPEAQGLTCHLENQVIFSKQFTIRYFIKYVEEMKEEYYLQIIGRK